MANDQPGAGGGSARSAVQVALDEAAASPLVVPAEQLPLLPTKTRADDEPKATEGRGVGRPRGSRNRSTVELARYLKANYAHPVIGMAEIYSRSVHVLAAELKCSPLEAFHLQLTAMREVAPYVAQKLPTMIDARHLVEEGGARDERSLLAEVAQLVNSLGLDLSKVLGEGVTIEGSAAESKTEEKQ